MEPKLYESLTCADGGADEPQTPKRCRQQPTNRDIRIRVRSERHPVVQIHQAQDDEAKRCRERMHCRLRSTSFVNVQLAAELFSVLFTELQVEAFDVFPRKDDHLDHDTDDQCEVQQTEQQMHDDTSLVNVSC